MFLSAARAAFAGSGEVEDGVLGMPDIVCVVSSLVDQVRGRSAEPATPEHGMKL